MGRSKLWLSLVLGSCALAAHADTVYLSDGSEIGGTIIEDNSNVVVVKRPNGTVQSFRKGNVDAVVYDTTQRPVSKGIAQGEAVPGPKLAPPTTQAGTEAAQAQPGVVAPGASPGTPATPVNPAGPGVAAPVPPPVPQPGAAPLTKQPETVATPVTPASPTELKPAVAQTPPTVPAAPGDTKPATPPTAATDPKKKEPEWTPPPNLAGFPDKAPRMKADKEGQFMELMNALATPNPDIRARAKAQMLTFGPDVLPYAIAAAQHTNVEARAAAMDVIGQLPNSTEAIKAVIELMYSALPETGEPASYQVPYLRAGKTTLHKVAGQSFINVEPSSALIQVGMKSAIDWYKTNIDRLPKQISDPKLDATDPEFVTKLRKARELKLVKREWPRPAMSADIVNREPVGPGRTNITAKDVLSETDKKLNTLPTTNAYDTRNKETTRPTDPRDSALNRR